MARLPEDWREQVTAMVARRAPLDGALFAGGPALSPVAQIGVYRRQYELRLYEALVEEVPGLAHLVGEGIGALLWAYLDACPSRSWTLNRIADGLADWLASAGAPVEQVEMARLDRAVQRGFEAQDGRPLQPEDLGELPALRLQPAVTLLRLHTNVHQVRAAALGGTPPPALQRGLDIPLVIFRADGFRMRHWELEPAAWQVLDRLERGTLEALSSTVEDGLLAPEALPEAAQRWLHDFVAHQLVERADR